MPISAFSAFCLIEHIHRHELSLFMLGDDHLCDTFTVVYDKILLRQVYQHDTHLSTIVGIDRPWSI